MIHRPDIHELVDDLTRTRTHREPYVVRENGTTWTRGHLTTVPSLLHQLEHATAATTGDTGTGGYTSRPAAHLESLDTLIHIDLEAARWVRDLGEDDPGNTTACIRRLHGLHASAGHCGHDHPTRGGECCARHAIETSVRRWWSHARIVTGWDSPAWRPDNTCPVCEKRGTLRIRLSTEAGFCIECRETWGPDTIGLLADHIRHENHDTETQAENEAS